MAPDSAEHEERRAAVRQALGAISGLLPVGVVAVDPDGLSWYQNQRWEDVCGATGKSMRGRPWYAAVHRDDAARVAVEWRSHIGLRGRFGEFRAVAADGTVRRCRGETIPMVGPDQVVSGHIIVIRDGEGDGDGDGAGDGAEPLGTLTNTPVLEAVLDRSYDIITILNPDGSWRWSSGGAVRLLGHQFDFDPVNGILDLIHPDDRDSARRSMEKMIESRGRGTLMFRIRSADGSYRHLEALVDVLVDDPAINGVVVHARDITERLETRALLEASNRRLTDLISSMHTAMVMEDEHRRVVVTNEAFVELFRLPTTPGGLVGRTLESVGWSPGALLESVTARHQRLEGIRITLFDGRILECDCVPMYVHEAFKGHLLVLRDVTDQARAQAERERLLASERQENLRLAELDAYKSEFLASVSHELRTPLTSIVAYSQMLRQMVLGRGDPDEVEILEVIYRNVNRLLRLSGDLLVLDSLESGALPLTVSQVDVAATLRHSVSSIEPAAIERGVRLDASVSEGPAITGDVERIGQLFDNLLSNAVKFTPAGGHVTVTAGPSRGPDGSDSSDGSDRSVWTVWTAEISDTGMGIPEDEQELLFERFFRASNVTRLRLPGVGLGLSIAQAIAELHRGTISVQSTLGVGTTLTVQLGGHQPEVKVPTATAKEPTASGS